MEKRFYLRTFRGVVAGMVVTMSLAQAADIGAPLLENRYGKATAPPPASPSTEAASAVSQDDRDAALKGAQGPLRTEAGDQMTTAGQELVRRDLEEQRYPMTREVGIP